MPPTCLTTGYDVQRFEVHKGVAAPLLRDNVDTDAIIPSREMNRVSKAGLGDALFAAWRYDSDRQPRPDFVLNQPRYLRSTILLGGENFGCGSSREFAVWALADFGIRAVIALSFGAIFRGNCLSNGVLPISLPRATLDALATRASSHDVTVDLKACVVRCADVEAAFEIDALDRERLLEGQDDIDRTLRHADALAQFLTRDRSERPWAYLA